MTQPQTGRDYKRVAALYFLMIAAAIVCFFTVQRMSVSLVAPAPAVDGRHFDPGHASKESGNLLHVLLALPVIIMTARVLGAAFRRLGQPPVIGEVIAGILLGPSLLGRVWPEASAYVLTPQSAPALQIIAQVGVILFMFLVGLELNARSLRRNSHTTIAISHASIVVPFLLGAALALWLYPRHATSDVPFTVFALFMGVSISVTAFPVLARILTDRGLHATPLGVVALTCAAVDDVTAWCLLALVVSIARSQASDALTTVGLVLGFVVLMIWLVRPLLRRLVEKTERAGRLGQETIAMIVVALLLSALATEAIGIHALFGSFLLGAIIAHDSLLARELTHKLHDIVVILFLPAFFAYVGMRTEIGLLDGFDEWLACGVIIAVACLGKFGGSAVAAHFVGMPWRDSAALGILMNTRGLMELIVLNVGLELGVISPKLFAMLVIMAIVTTVMTAPILQWLMRGRNVFAAVESAGDDRRRVD